MSRFVVVFGSTQVEGDEIAFGRYKEYIKVLMGDGPKGSYRQTCRNCKMRKGDDDILM